MGAKGCKIPCYHGGQGGKNSIVHWAHFTPCTRSPHCTEILFLCKFWFTSKAAEATSQRSWKQPQRWLPVEVFLAVVFRIWSDKCVRTSPDLLQRRGVWEVCLSSLSALVLLILKDDDYTQWQAGDGTACVKPSWAISLLSLCTLRYLEQYFLYLCF